MAQLYRYASVPKSTDGDLSSIPHIKKIEDYYGVGIYYYDPKYFRDIGPRLYGAYIYGEERRCKTIKSMRELISRKFSEHGLSIKDIAARRKQEEMEAHPPHEPQNKHDTVRRIKEYHNKKSTRSSYYNRIAANAKAKQRGMYHQILEEEMNAKQPVRGAQASSTTDPDAHPRDTSSIRDSEVHPSDGQGTTQGMDGGNQEQS